MLPALAWLAVCAVAIQAGVLVLGAIGLRKQYYLASRAIFSLLHLPLLYLLQYSGTKVILCTREGDEDVLKTIGHDQAIILSNHRGDVDWLVGLQILDAGGGLGACKAIIKRSLLAVPLFGFLWWCVDFVSVRRNWQQDSKALEEGYKAQHAYRSCQVPYSLSIFPEGTRLTPKKLLDSQAFAKSRGLSEFEHVLCPRTKGVWSAVNGLKLDAIYDATVAPAGGANMMTLACARPAELRVYFERLEPKSVPRDEESLNSWLFQRWEVKEERLRNLAKGEGLCCASEAPLISRTLPVRSEAFSAVVGTFLWWLVCTAVFVTWCIQSGHHWMLGVAALGTVLLMALCFLVLQTVHFSKGKTPAEREARKKSS